MKLIFCPSCEDVKKLQREVTWCRCMRSWGWYAEDGLNATIAGQAVPIGFSNSSFTEALFDASLPHNHGPLGVRFEAFVIPMPCKTITRKEA